MAGLPSTRPATTATMVTKFTPLISFKSCCVKNETTSLTLFVSFLSFSHPDVVAVLLERGANINDPGGPLCEGVTPLHDALACGNLKVARLLVELGASVTLRNSKVGGNLEACHNSM